MAMHLTGEYPHWWWGKRFTRPILGWVTGESGDAVRDNGQRILLGAPGERGAGWIPKRCLTNVYGRAHGVSDLLSYIRIRHVSGGTSLLRTRYYEQGRKKWQGPTVDVVWLDEEPPKDIFAEAQARTVASGGMLMLTFTPILGRSEVVLMFLSPTKRGTTRAEVVMKHEDSYHLPPLQELQDKYERHEWEARIFAEPAMGEGLIFPVIEQDFVVAPFDIPHWWPAVRRHRLRLRPPDFSGAPRVGPGYRYRLRDQGVPRQPGDCGAPRDRAERLGQAALRLAA